MGVHSSRLQEFESSGTFDGKYIYENCLGRGAFGKVYKATDKRGSPVAIKLITCPLEELEDTFEKAKREAHTLKQLSHPNIIRFVEFYSRTQGRNKQFAIVMEFCPDGSLKSYLSQDRYRRPPIRKRVQWYRQLASAVQYMHMQGVAHRDIKPDNILKHGDDLKIGDVGLSKVVHELGYPSMPIYQYMQTFAGTCSYMAPEVFAGHHMRKCDVFSLGLVFVMMAESPSPLSPRVKWRGEHSKSLGKLLYDHRRELHSTENPCRYIHPPIQHATEGEVSLYNNMLLYDHHVRYSMDKVLQQIERISVPAPDLGSIIAASDSVDELGKYLISLSHTSNRLNCMREFANSIVKVSKDLDELSGIESKPYQCDRAIQDVRKCCRTAYNMLDKMDDITYYCQSYMMTDAIAGCNKQPPDFSALKNLLVILEQSSNEAQQYYHELESDCGRASRSCITAAGTCRRRAEDEERKKNVTKVVGGTAAAGAITTGVGVGVAASVVAGIFTFGIGTIVGLGLTAAGATVASVATGAGIHALASKYSEAQDKFENAAYSFRSLSSDSERLYELAVRSNEDIHEAMTIINDIAVRYGYNLTYKQTQAVHQKLVACQEASARSQPQSSSICATVKNLVD